ncbi:Mis12-Mtw1 protein family-domain-containing protein [Chiua virens]|nr:Mis12-Mtw1 protein family-domain-containing protein [Chiua virens]
MRMRGKRISTSSANTGAIPQPHASVADSGFYRHIDRDLPEPQRVRQLLVWSAARASSRLSEASSAEPSKPLSVPSSSGGKDPPLLDDRRKRILKTVQDDFIRMLAEKKIDTVVYSNRKSDKTMKEGTLRSNEQNVWNRARQVTLQQYINRAQAESEAWLRAEEFYHQYATNSKADLERRLQSLRPPSAEATGKQRATSHELQDDWSWLLPREDEVSDGFKEKVDLELIKHVMSSGPQPGIEFQGPLDQEIRDLQFKVDSLYSYVNSVVKATEVAEAELDYRFFPSLTRNVSAITFPPTGAEFVDDSLLIPATHTTRTQPSAWGKSKRHSSGLISDRQGTAPGKIGDATRKAVRLRYSKRRKQVLVVSGNGE